MVGADRRLGVDANILIRAVLGLRARSIILKNADRTAFLAPEVAYDDARKYLPALAAKRGAGPEVAVQTLEVLDAFEGVVLAVARETYEVALLDAESRLEGRDPDDWPILAAATVLVCPIWSEDQNFFGTASPPGPLIVSSCT